MHRDLIVFGEDWGGLPSSTQHLMSHLSHDRKILWVNSIGLRQPHLSTSDIQRAAKKGLSFARSLLKKTTPQDTTVNPNFRVLNPLTIPAPRSPLARKISGEALLRQIKPMIQKMELNNPAIWASLPTADDFTHQLPSMPTVYYCGDDFAGLNGVDHDTISHHENDLVEQAKLVIAASEPLCEKFPSHKTQLLSHGVDLDLFTQKTSKALDLPNNGKPTAGFYGSLSEWLDQDLLDAVIQANADWNFVFIGEEHVDLSRLKAHANSYFLGPKAHTQLASYSQHWQVSLLPFKLNAQILACNPLKLKEYLATGTPVISTDFPAVHRYSEHIEIATQANEFTQALNRQLTPNLNANIDRQITVSQEAWQQKAATVSQWLAAL